MQVTSPARLAVLAAALIAGCATGPAPITPTPTRTPTAAVGAAPQAACDALDAAFLDALVAWVERGVAPEGVVSAARGAGSLIPNPEVPAAWSPTRTRLLCPYPSVARFRGTGDAEVAASFACVRP